MERAHIITYDVAGTVVASGASKPCRTSGLVTHTHQLLAGLAQIAPELSVAVTHTGADHSPHRAGGYYLHVDGGQLVMVQGLATGQRDLLGQPGQPGVDPVRVTAYYEDQIDRLDNPLYTALARQYAHVVRVAGTPYVLAQNINAIVCLFKAEELGYLPARQGGSLRLTGVVQDTTGTPARFGYMARRITCTDHKVQLIAVSRSVHDALCDMGVRADLISVVPNGLDVAAFTDRVQTARTTGTFAEVSHRNAVPPSGTVVLMSARRVAWKGHHDVIEAVAILARRGIIDFTLLINGHGTMDPLDLSVESHLIAHIETAGLTGRVILLDSLSPLEVAACYDAAAVAVHPSRHPEAWGYANTEAMLAETAVIATNHGAPADYLDHGQSGLLVPPNDPAAIADALALVLTNPQKRRQLAHHGQAVASRYTATAMATAYHHIMSGQPLPPGDHADR